MSLPSNSDILENVFAFEGQPFMVSTNSTSISTNNVLDNTYGFEGQPFVAPFATATTYMKTVSVTESLVTALQRQIDTFKSSSISTANNLVRLGELGKKIVITLSKTGQKYVQVTKSIVESLTDITNKLLPKSIANTISLLISFVESLIIPMLLSITESLEITINKKVEITKSATISTINSIVRLFNVNKKLTISLLYNGQKYVQDILDMNVSLIDSVFKEIPKIFSTSISLLIFFSKSFIHARTFANSINEVVYVQKQIEKTIAKIISLTIQFAKDIDLYIINISLSITLLPFIQRFISLTKPATISSTNVLVRLIDYTKDMAITLLSSGQKLIKTTKIILETLFIIFSWAHVIIALITESLQTTLTRKMEVTKSSIISSINNLVRLVEVGKNITITLGYNGQKYIQETITYAISLITDTFKTFPKTFAASISLFIFLSKSYIHAKNIQVTEGLSIAFTRLIELTKPVSISIINDIVRLIDFSKNLVITILPNNIRSIQTSLNYVVDLVASTVKTFPKTFSTSIDESINIQKQLEKTFLKAIALIIQISKDVNLHTINISLSVMLSSTLGRLVSLTKTASASPINILVRLINYSQNITISLFSNGQKSLQITKTIVETLSIVFAWAHAIDILVTESLSTVISKLVEMTKFIQVSTINSLVRLINFSKNITINMFAKNLKLIFTGFLYLIPILNQTIKQINIPISLLVSVMSSLQVSIIHAIKNLITISLSTKMGRFISLTKPYAISPINSLVRFFDLTKDIIVTILASGYKLIPTLIGLLISTSVDVRNQIEKPINLTISQSIKIQRQIDKIISVVVNTILNFSYFVGTVAIHLSYSVSLVPSLSRQISAIKNILLSPVNNLIRLVDYSQNLIINISANGIKQIQTTISYTITLLSNLINLIKQTKLIVVSSITKLQRYIYLIKKTIVGIINKGFKQITGSNIVIILNEFISISRIFELRKKLNLDAIIFLKRIVDKTISQRVLSIISTIRYFKNTLVTTTIILLDHSISKKILITKLISDTLHMSLKRNIEVTKKISIASIRFLIRFIRLTKIVRISLMSRILKQLNRSILITSHIANKLIRKIYKNIANSVMTSAFAAPLRALYIAILEPLVMSLSRNIRYKLSIISHLSIFVQIQSHIAQLFVDSKYVVSRGIKSFIVMYQTIRNIIYYRNNNHGE